MKQLFILCVLLAIANTGFAEDEPVTERPTTICYVGYVEESNENTTIAEFEQKSCKRGEDCRTQFEVNHGKTMIYKSCHSRKACREQQDITNEHQCYSGNALRHQVRQCLFCCTKDLCNDKVVLPAPGDP